MDLGLTNRCALVGGSSAGIGYAIAKELGREGCRLMLCARSEPALQTAADRISDATGAEVAICVADLTSIDDIDRLTTTTQQRFGVVDILINNVGGPPPGRFADLSEADWRKGVDLTLLSAVETTRRVLQPMQKQRWGRIVNVASTSVKQPIDGLLLSNSLRSAVVGWAKTLANEVAADGVLVNNACPGYTATERLNELAANVAEREGIAVDEVRARWQEEIPVKRIAEPEEFARVAVFLASEAASYVTGTTVVVDGGRSQTMT